MTSARNCFLKSRIQCSHFTLFNLLYLSYLILDTGMVDFPQFLAMMSRSYKEEQTEEDDKDLREAFKVTIWFIRNCLHITCPWEMHPF